MNQMHMFFALLALGVGLTQLLMRKGTDLHKKVGWVWLISMAGVCLSSFFLTGFMASNGFGWLHGLSVWTLVCLFFTVYFARKKNIKRHRRFVVGAYLGLVVAGSAAVLMPNRLLHTWLFG